MGPCKTEQELRKMRRKNNPLRYPVGDSTGRCRHCGGQDVWDVPSAYGCNHCGAVFVS